MGILLVSLEGNIGAGKSSVLRGIKSRLPNAYVFQEPVKTWESVNLVGENGSFNPIQLFYEKKIDTSCFQNFVLSSYARELGNFLSSVPDGSLVITERSLASSVRIFAEAALDNNHIERESFALINYSYETLCQVAPELCSYTKMIYIATPAVLCRDRMYQRGRNYEEAVSLDYLLALEQKHEKYYDSSVYSNVVKIDGSLGI